jgi:predicted O-methyltransferase YrrM
MALTFQAPDWREYVMDWYEPHRQVEPLEREVETIDQALDALVEGEILPHAQYDTQKMLAHREAVRDTFDIPWTAISHRMQRLLYAINAISQPRVMVAVGIFCGNTFISNAGAAIGPGADYTAQQLVGLEIRPGEAERARRNVTKLVGVRKNTEILAEDGIPWLQRYPGTIDLLYLDADGPRGQGKSIYLELLNAGLHALRSGSLVLAHNSVNDARGMSDYLDYVQNPSNFAASMNMIVDDQGLEVSIR